MNLTEIYNSVPNPFPNYVYIVAEVGINHNGDLEIAKQLVKLAKEVGCDAVKFQKRDINIVYTKDFLKEPRTSPWGNTQKAQKEGLEFNKEQFEILRDLSGQLKIDFSCSAWDLNSLEFLDTLNLDFQKVPSALATNQSFLEEVAKRKKITLLSLGMCEEKDVDAAINIFRHFSCPVIPMHCVSTYPSLETELNLRQIINLRNKYKTNVGYSGHEASVSPSIVAASLGAQVIERHITLDRTMYGSDQSSSLEKRGILELVTILRKLPDFYGSEIKTISDNEKIIAKKLRYWE